MNPRRTRLEQQLASLEPSRLEITDFSAAHEGHAGKPPDMQETHLAVLIISEKFEGKSRVERQRMVHECLAQEFSEGLHALNIKALTPKESE